MTDRRDAYLSPHKAAHEASVRVAMQQAVPKKFGQLVSWFLREWAMETPTTIHIDDVWRDYVTLTEDRKAEGGSLLGSLKWHDDFRRYTEGSPHETDEDGRYLRPLRSAIARLAGRGGHEGPTEKLEAGPYMARFLYRYGCSQGSLGEVADSMGIPRQVAPIYAERALMRAFQAYAVGPGVLQEDAA